MHSLLAAKAIQHIKRLNSKELKFGYTRDSLLRPLPLFSGKTSSIVCRDDDIFDLYAIINGIRYIRRSVNFLTGAHVMYLRKLYAPSVVLSYTAAFHGLNAHISCEGRPFFDSSESGPMPVEMVAGILKKNNKWDYEPRKRGHATRWKELQQCFSSSDYVAPPCFDRLFKYMYQGQRKKGVTLLEVMKEPEKYRLEMSEMLPEFLTRIAEVRHLAIYGAVGEDPHAVEGLWNGDPYAANCIHKQGEAFLDFASGLIGHTASQIGHLFEGQKLNKDTQIALGFCVRFPWYDEVKLDLLKENKLRNALESVEALVTPP